jgi:hypothetical protein
MKDETIYNEEVYHTGNGQETKSNPDYMDPETGESVPYEASKAPQEKVVAEYMKKCNLDYSDEEDKNQHVNYDGFDT